MAKHVCINEKTALQDAVRIYCNTNEHKLPNGASVFVRYPPEKNDPRQPCIHLHDTTGKIATHDAWGKVEIDPDFRWADFDLRIKQPFWKRIFGKQPKEQQDEDLLQREESD